MLLRTRNVAQKLSESDVLYVLNDLEREKLKECLVKIFEDFSKVCEKHSLTYMLGGGSALGSVRHRGFIPWDDDLDILMPRKDYDKFITIFENELANEYDLFVPNSTYDVTHMFAKLVKKKTRLTDLYNISTPFSKGVAIDIFPIENAPSNRFIRFLKGAVANFLRYVGLSCYMFRFRNDMLKSFFCSSRQGKFNYRLRLFIGMICGCGKYEVVYNIYDKLVQQKRDTGIYTIPTGRKYYGGETADKRVFFPPQKGRFEGRVVYLPNDVDAYLRNLYGNYMEIPPIEKRERHYYVDFEI